jgi:predicted O-methyltransferase YrrM
MIEELLNPTVDGLTNAVFVETGCGVSTVALAEIGRRIGAAIYSCDYNAEKADELNTTGGDSVSSVNFLIGDSLESLRDISDQHSTIHFLFLDSAASAMHTFREFSAVERCLKPGSIVLIDNAALPCQKNVLSPVRKGKILVPYLLASPFWEVHSHPGAGDSMISAIMHAEPDYADREYEDPEYIDNWRALFNRELGR